MPVPLLAWLLGAVAVGGLYVLGRKQGRPADTPLVPRMQDAPQDEQAGSLLDYASNEGASPQVGLGGSAVLNPSLSGFPSASQGQVGAVNGGSLKFGGPYPGSANAVPGTTYTRPYVPPPPAGGTPKQ